MVTNGYDISNSCPKISKQPSQARIKGKDYFHDSFLSLNQNELLSSRQSLDLFQIKEKRMIPERQSDCK